MKVTIGTVVSGECGSGPVVAMSREWCIYLDGKSEAAEPWTSIMVVADAPEVAVSSVPEMDGIPKEDAP